MIARARAKPGVSTYCTPGASTLPHFMGVLMEQSSGISLNHVPFLDLRALVFATGFEGLHRPEHRDGCHSQALRRDAHPRRLV
jgi:hypothetical protein